MLFKYRAFGEDCQPVPVDALWSSRSSRLLMTGGLPMERAFSPYFGVADKTGALPQIGIDCAVGAEGNSLSLGVIFMVCMDSQPRHCLGPIGKAGRQVWQVCGPSMALDCLSTEAPTQAKDSS